MTGEQTERERLADVLREKWNKDWLWTDVVDAFLAAGYVRASATADDLETAREIVAEHMGVAPDKMEREDDELAVCIAAALAQSRAAAERGQFQLLELVKDADENYYEEKEKRAAAEERIAELEKALNLFVKQWNACGPNSDFGRYFSNVRDAANAALAGKAKP